MHPIVFYEAVRREACKRARNWAMTSAVAAQDSDCGVLPKVYRNASQVPRNLPLSPVSPAIHTVFLHDDLSEFDCRLHVYPSAARPKRIETSLSRRHAALAH